MYIINIKYRRIIQKVLSLFLVFSVGCKNEKPDQRLKEDIEEIQWSEGYLDIHHIHSGRGDAAFTIFPDGTTLLFDAGEAHQRDKDLYYPIYPSEDKNAGEWIANYIEQVAPRGIIDYAVISHFHTDHYGVISKNSPISKDGGYKLAGITRVGELIPIGTLIDRGYPDYDYPVDLREHFSIKDSTFLNYLKFAEYNGKNRGMVREKFQAGHNDQITLKYNKKSYPNFSVRNIKSNQRIWAGQDTTCFDYVFKPDLLHEPGKFSENALSNILKYNYGSFDYYTGGDLPGFFGYQDYDMESTISEVVGEVDVLTLNHHGYKDATNETFLDALKPQVIVHQAIHDPHFQENAMKRMASRNLSAFSIWMSSTIEKKYKDLVDKVYKSKRGHVMIRVSRNGDQFKVLILENDGPKLRLKQTFGPYTSRN